MKTLVIQSAAAARPNWVTQCMAGVASWAQSHDFDYKSYGDEFFEVLPEWYREKLAGRGPILADLARLIHMKSALQKGAERVIWCDADLLVLDEGWLPPTPSHSLFGDERWLQRDKVGRLQVRRQPHNAFMVFTATAPVLDFLIYTSQSIIARVDPVHIAPQMVGPKMLKALHSLASFDLEPAAGALSPLLLAALLEGDDDVVAFFRASLTVPPAMLNLCASLIADSTLDIAKIRQTVLTKLH